MGFSEETIEYMRQDLESGMALTKIEMLARDLVANGLKCNACGNKWQRDENSTGYCEICESANISSRDFDEEFKKWKERQNRIGKEIF